MFHFAEGHSLYRRLGLFLLLPQLALFIWGTPPLAEGIWLQTEPLSLALYVFAVLTCLWLLAGIWKNRLIREPGHPVWLLLAAWVLWQIIPTMFAQLPWRSWFGPAQVGEGVAWHISLLLIFMLAYPLWQVAAFRRILLSTAFANIAVESLLHLFHPLEGDPWKPQRWADYLAFMAGYIWIAAIPDLRARKPAWILWTVILLGFALFISGNRTAQFLIMGAMGVCLIIPELCKQEKYRRWFEPGRNWRIITILLCILPMLWVGLSPRLVSYEPEPDEISFKSIMSDRSSSFGTRMSFNELGWVTMAHEPARWLTGGGWGRFTDDIFKYALLDKVEVFHNGRRFPNWEYVDTDVYHSHNQAMEALLSLGLPGLLLWMAIPLAILWYLPRQHFWSITPMLIGLIYLKYLWFEMPQVLPYWALMLATLCTTPAKEKLPRPAVLPLIRIALITAALIMSWTSWQQWLGIRYGQELSSAIKLEDTDLYSPEWLAGDIKRGGERLMASAMFYVDKAEFLAGHKRVTASTLAWYGNFMEAAHVMAVSPTIGVRGKWLEYWMVYKLFSELHEPVLKELSDKARPLLLPSVLNLCREAPLRDDIATPLLFTLNSYTNDDVHAQVNILLKILAIAPDHRGALWVLGHILIQDKKYEREGRDMIKTALSLGVERVYPVTKAQRMKYQ